MATALGLAAATPAAARRHHHPAPPPKAVYAQTNNPKANTVIAFKRRASGTLVQNQVIKTGGTGIPAEPPFGFPIVDTQGSMQLTPNGRLLFVANTGSNTISAFRVTKKGLKLAGQAASGGILPMSLAIRGHRLYVLNELSGNIFALQFTDLGAMAPITDSERALSVVGPNGVAAGLSISPNGRIVTATMRYLPFQKGTKQNGLIDTFVVRGDGSTGPAIQHQAATPTPFGSAFTPNGVFLASSAGYVVTPSNTMPDITDPEQFDGALASYSTTNSGHLTNIASLPTGGRASCWLVLTPNGKYAYVSNTLSDSVMDTLTGKGGISEYAVAPGGGLTLVKQYDTSGTGFPDEEAVSKDGKYLDIVVPVVATQPATPQPASARSHIDTFRIAADGSLTKISSVSGLPVVISGLAGY